MSFVQEASQVWSQLLADVKQKFAATHHQQGVLDSFRAFSAAVDWRVRQRFVMLLACKRQFHKGINLFAQEPWLVVVLSFQTLLFFSLLVMRKSNTYLTTTFVFASKPSGPPVPSPA